MSVTFPMSMPLNLTGAPGESPLTDPVREIGFNDRFRSEIIGRKYSAEQTDEYRDHDHNGHADPKMEFVF